MPRGGVLIIGSLLWRTDAIRALWRDSRLDLVERRRVRIPIRYGRLSKTMTYTMVFSTECAEASCLGTGWAVPFRHSVETAADLKNEAIALARAEINDEETSDLNRSWFTVGLLVNPSSPSRRTIEAFWKEFYPGLGQKHSFLASRLSSEHPAVDRHGHFLIDWPAEVDGSAIADIDFLLGTLTVPSLTRGSYPPAPAIADAWIAAKDAEYFNENRRNGIETFQDSTIGERLAKAGLLQHDG
jgi:hypothetical protein